MPCAARRRVSETETDSMRRDPRVIELLLRYDELEEQGQSLAPEELCRNCPELLEELRRAIGDLKAVQQLLSPPGTGVEPQGATVEPSTLNDPTQPAAARSGRGPWPSVVGYEIEAELGRGAMGVVYRARDIRLKRLVALKMILVGDYAGPEQLARFRAEAEAAARLRNPGIVQVYEIGEQSGRPYIALELVECGTLARRLAGGPLAAGEAARIVQALAIAVEHAHGCGVVHRDLKPANILLARDGQPKVSDFGLAKFLDEDATRTRTGAVLGTPSYMAPEQAAGRVRELGPTTDVYALGTILYEAVTGRPPFQAPTVSETLEQVRFHEPVPPGRLQRRLPRSLEIVCLKCLEKEPRRRYASAGELAEDLRRYLANEPILARPPGWLDRFRLWSRRPERVHDAGAFSVFLGFVCMLWCLVGFAHIGVGVQQPPDVARALAVLAALMVVIYVPPVFIGLRVMRRRPLWLWAGALVAALDFLICLLCLAGPNPVSNLMDIGVVPWEPRSRLPLFSLLAILIGVQLFGYCVAIRAHYANRDAVR
jgi:hypothetical protein